MTEFWLESPESLLSPNFNDVNGILNLATILTVVLTIIGLYKNYSDSLKLGLLAIVIIIAVSRCSPETLGNILFTEPSEQYNQGLETQVEVVEVVDVPLPCRPLTEDNLWGNPTIAEYGTPSNYSGVCTDDNSETVQKGVFDSYPTDSVNNKWVNNRGGDRSYSVIDSDPLGFAHAVYNDANNCKSGSIYRNNPTQIRTPCQAKLDLTQTIPGNYSALNPDPAAAIANYNFI